MNFSPRFTGFSGFDLPAALGIGFGARFLLRNCDRVGSSPVVVGRPRISNLGTILIGDGLQFCSAPVRSHLLAERGAVIQIGDGVSIGHGTGIAARRSIQIGDGTRIGAFVLMMDTDYHVAGDAAALADVAPVVIGANVRIGNRVTILRGSHIGDGATVIDGSVVSGEVPAGARVEGVPARAQRTSIRPPQEDGVDDRVRRVAQASFRLLQPPDLAHGPQQIAAWDSLGSLSFMLALEEEFDVSVSAEQMHNARSLSDVASVFRAAVD